jgi:hypothetical protein
MATDQLKDAWEQLEKLSPEKQNVIAEQILEAIEEAKWDETFASPEAQAYAAKERKEVIAEHLAGKTKKYIPGKSIADLIQ